MYTEWEMGKEVNGWAYFMNIWCSLENFFIGIFMEYTSIWCEHKFSILLLSGELLRIFPPHSTAHTNTSWHCWECGNVIHWRLVVAAAAPDAFTWKCIVMRRNNWSHVLQLRLSKRHFIVTEDEGIHLPKQTINRTKINYWNYDAFFSLTFLSRKKPEMEKIQGCRI